MSLNSVRGARASLLFIAAIAAILLAAPAALAAPANDAFADAEALPAQPPESVLASTFEASKQAGEPNHAGNPGGHSVWYSWTPNRSGMAGIVQSCAAGGFDALIAVYTGTDVSALTEVVSDEDAPPPNCFSEDDEVEFPVTAGTTYRIAIDGRDGAEGFTSFILSASPANDDFAAAATIAPDPPQDAFGFNRFAAAEDGEPAHAGEPGGRSLWYSWTPATSGPVSISTCTSFSMLDTLLAVYTGSSFGALTLVAGNDDAPLTEGAPGCSWSDSEVHLNVSAGTTYRIAVDAAGGTVGRFGLRIRGRPANDGFPNPQVLSATPTGFSSQSSNLLASKQAGEPNHAGNPGGHSVWYSWTPATSGPVSISTCGKEAPHDLDPLIAVYTGTDVAALTEVVSSDEFESHQCNESSRVEFTAVAGTTYRIAIDGRDGSEGRFDLEMSSPPANDDFANAQTLGASLPASGIGRTLAAGKQAGEPDHAGNPGGHSVWYSWTPASSGPAEISVCYFNENSPDTLLAVYTGASLGALMPVASNDDSGGACKSGASLVRFDATAGTTYRIAVDVKTPGVGSFSLQIKGKPANDDFATPEAIEPDPFGASGTTIFAGKQAGEPDHAGNPGGHSVWFSWTPTSSGPVSIAACRRDAGFDPLLAVYTGNALNSLVTVASNDDAPANPISEPCESPKGASEVVFDAVAGTTYRIVVDGKGEGEGQFGLNFERPPPHDDFADPEVLNGDEIWISGSTQTRLASKQAGEPDHAGDPGGHSVWFSWTPTSSGPVAISTCTHIGGLDALLAVYTGSSLPGLTPVASNDDTPNKRCRATDGEVQFNTTAGTTYRIAVDAKATTFGRFQLSIDRVPANDDLGRARTLGGGFPRELFFESNRFASKQAGEPNHAGNPGGHSIWFKWTAPASGKVSVDTCGSGFDTLLAIYTGTVPGTLAPVADNDDGGGKCAPQSKLSFDAVANTIYKIAVDGKDGAQGSVDLNLFARPDNDDFDAARTIPGSIDWYSGGSTVLATKQTGEPNHAGNPGGNSIWFSWTPAEFAGEVDVDVCTDHFDPMVGIYTGASVDALTPIASADVGSGECDEGSSTRFTAIPRTTYRFAVDGAAGDTGRFELHLREAADQPSRLTVTRSGGGSGTVSSSPAGISCGSLCSHAFGAGSLVTLTAQPVAGSTFAGWSGGGCSGTGTCQVTLNADTSVTATFALLSGGGGGGGGGGGDNPPEQSKPTKKPLKCKPGFKKVKVKGKQKCVKKKKPGKHKGRGKGQGQKK